MKILILVAATMWFFSASAETQNLRAGQAPKFSNIARNFDGSVHIMIPDAADIYCKRLGMRLPTVRELAQLSAKFGAQGIEELNEGTTKYSYPIEARNADGKLDSFYFHSDGYKRPVGDYGNYQFWSSSLSDPAARFVLPFLLNGKDGRIEKIWSYYNYGAAVRCVVAP